MRNSKSLTTFCMAMTISMVSFAQAIFVVNNNPGAPTGTNVYTDWATAQSAATDGDIIYLVPSSISYGEITVTKPITIFGAGLIPDKDIGMKTSIGTLNIDASDVRISGLVSADAWNLGRNISNTTISNITVENSRFPYLRQYTTSVDVGNLLVRNNVLTTTASYKIHLTGNTSNVIITNNIIITSSSLSYGINGDGLTFTHNIFKYEGTSGNDGYYIEDVDNSTFSFNIFLGVLPAVPAACVGNNFNNNLSFGASDNAFSGLYTGGNNIAGDPLFVDLPLGNSWSDYYDPSLGGSSPAIDIDGSGTDAGVTGGATPWDADGSLLPTVQSINIPSVIPVGSDLDVNVIGKGN